MEDITVVLKTVDDAKSSEAAAEKLGPLVERMNKLTKEAAKNPEAAGKAVDADEVAEYAKVNEAFSKEMTRVMSNPDFGTTVTEALSKMGQ